MNKINFYLEKLSLFSLGLFLLLFPLAIETLTTDSVILPKQALLIGISLLVILLWGVKILREKTVKIRTTPFDGAVLLFTTIILLSSIFSANRADSLISAVPLLFSAIFFFLVTNSVKGKKEVMFLCLCFLGGASLLGLNSILAYFKIYPLPFAFAKSQTFTPLGSILDQAIYLISALSIALYVEVPKIKALFAKKEKFNVRLLPFDIMSIIILGGTITSGIFLFTLQKPLLLPFDTGFQTSFAAISQDPTRIIQNFLLGSGFGTFINDFTRFKQVSFNQNPTLWNLTFIRSSSFVLELLATTGILGFSSFLFLVYKILKEKPLFLPLILIIILSFLLPFSFVPQVLFFIILSLFVSLYGLSNQKNFDVELSLVATKKGMLALSETPSHNTLSKLLPFVVFLITLIFIGTFGFLGVRYVMADFIFQNSLVAASQNNGSKAYSAQLEALNLVNYKDSYHRVFSQTNLALANSLSNSTPKGASPSAQTQQTIYNLIQQSINAGRTATTLSPQTATNWQNLSSIYRSLIGFGKNADSFAVLSNQQAIALDPNNPQEYINLGGIYYQLNLLDKAAEQFQIAVNLKPDFANAYYNLAHTYEQKGDLKTALSYLQTVQTLVKNDKANLDKVTAEIADLQKGISTSTQLNQLKPSLPVQNPPIAIPSPSTSPSTSPSPSPQVATPSAQ